MTYQQLIDKLSTLTPEQLQQNVTVFDAMNDEFFPVFAHGVAHGCSVLDNNHFFLMFNE